LTVRLLFATISHVNCEVYVSTSKGKLLDEFKLFYEELVTPANKPAQTRIRRVRATRVK
jgi:hypothetical protein